MHPVADASEGLNSKTNEITMCLQIKSFLIAVTSCLLPLAVFAQATLDFSGTRTPIYSGSNVIGFTFANIYGDGSDALLDVTFNHAQSSSFYGTRVIDTNGTTVFPEVKILNGQSEANLVPGAPTSLYILLAFQADGSFVDGLVNGQVDFFLHNSEGQALGNMLFSFVTRDLDGQTAGTQAAGILMDEQMSLGPLATNINAIDPDYISVVGDRISSTQSFNVTAPQEDFRATVSWDQPVDMTGRWSWEMDILTGRMGTATWINRATSRGFIFDGFYAVPEPSSSLLICLAGVGFLTARYRRGACNKNQG